ncbi:hypothetical protein RQN30_10970 [Arcanobacterium hippocoleae]
MEKIDTFGAKVSIQILTIVFTILWMFCFYRCTELLGAYDIAKYPWVYRWQTLPGLLYLMVGVTSAALYGYFIPQSWKSVFSKIFSNKEAEESAGRKEYARKI